MTHTNLWGELSSCKSFVSEYQTPLQQGAVAQKWLVIGSHPQELVDVVHIVGTLPSISDLPFTVKLI